MSIDYTSFLRGVAILLIILSHSVGIQVLESLPFWVEQALIYFFDLLVMIC